jgi:4-amino-4-deoxy-L-arabinose transferase-like glycosyltransferase
LFARLSRFPFRIYTLALFLRLGVAMLAHALPIGLDDMFQYDMLGRSLAGGQGYRWYDEHDLKLIQQFLPMELPPEYDPRGVLTSFRPPAYPAFLALVYMITGSGPGRFFAVRLAQGFLTATLAPLTWALALRMGFVQRTAKYAAFIVAVFPLLIVYSIALVTENLFIVALALALLLSIRAEQSGKTGAYALAGAAFSLVVLTRSVASILVGIIAAWFWAVAPARKKAVANSLVFCLVFLLALAPWVLRNSRLHHSFTWVESSFGYNLYLGYHPQSTGTFQFGISLDLIPILDDGERSARGVRAAIGFIRDDPGRIPGLMVYKAGYFWGLHKRALIYFYGGGMLGDWPAWLLALVLALDALPMVLLAPLAAVGLMCGRIDRYKAFMACVIASYCGVHMLVIAESRFNLALLPILAILGMYSIVEKPWHNSTRRQRFWAVALAALLAINWTCEIWRDWPLLGQLFGPGGSRLGLPY